MSYGLFENLSRKHADTWFKSTRGGDTGQGHTWETRVAEKKEDNIARPDIYGIEVKTSSSKSKNQRVRMFTHMLGCENELFENFGNIATTKKRLCKQLRIGKPVATWNKCQIVEVSCKGSFYELTARHHSLEIPTICQFDKKSIATILEEKMKNLAIVDVKKKKVGGEIYYNYPSFTFFGELNYNKFFTALDEGKIAIEFRVSDSKNNGTSFNANKKLFESLYEDVRYWSAK